MKEKKYENLRGLVSAAGTVFERDCLEERFSTSTFPGEFFRNFRKLFVILLPRFLGVVGVSVGTSGSLSLWIGDGFRFTLLLIFFMKPSGSRLWLLSERSFRPLFDSFSLGSVTGVLESGLVPMFSRGNRSSSDSSSYKQQQKHVDIMNTWEKRTKQTFSLKLLSFKKTKQTWTISSEC